MLFRDIYLFITDFLEKINVLTKCNLFRIDQV